MKLLKLLAITLGAIAVIFSVLVLWMFATTGAGYLFATYPDTTIMGNLGVALTTLLINCSAMFIIFLTSYLWACGVVAIYWDNIISFYDRLSQVKITTKKSDTL